MKKDYTGTIVVPYVTQKGDTYGALAKHYSLPNYEGIINYNFWVKKILRSQDPKLMPTGKRILIPMSIDGYRKRIKELECLVNVLDGMKMERLFEIEQLENEKAAYTIALNFLADVATSLASIGIKSAEAAKSAVTAAKSEAIEEAAFNSWYFAHNNVLSFSEELSIGIQAASKKIKVSGGEKIFDKSSELLFGSSIGKSLALGRKIAKAGSGVKKTEILSKAGLEFVADSSRAILEYMEWMKPSKWAETSLMQTLYYSITTGDFHIRESTKDWAKDAKENINNSLDIQRAALQNKIANLKQELNVVWHVAYKG